MVFCCVSEREACSLAVLEPAMTEVIAVDFVCETNFDTGRRCARLTTVFLPGHKPEHSSERRGSNFHV